MFGKDTIIIPRKYQKLEQRLKVNPIRAENAETLHFSVSKISGLEEVTLKRVYEEPQDIRYAVNNHRDSANNYLILNLVYGNGELAGTIITNVVEIFESKPEVYLPKKKALICVPRAGFDEKVLSQYKDPSDAGKIFDGVSEIVQRASGHEGNNCLGMVMESRMGKPQLMYMLQNADFIDLLPNDVYRPPATQQDLVLLVRQNIIFKNNIPLQNIAAEAYLKSAYHEEPYLNSALEKVSKYFAAEKKRLEELNPDKISQMNTDTIPNLILKSKC